MQVRCLYRWRTQYCCVLLVQHAPSDTGSSMKMRASYRAAGDPATTREVSHDLPQAASQHLLCSEAKGAWIEAGQNKASALGPDVACALVSRPQDLSCVARQESVKEMASVLP